MIFKGGPNQYVFTKKRMGRKNKRILLGKFDENGLFKTDDKDLINKFKLHFKYEDAETKTRHCKKCDFTCENQGEIMKHYRLNHKK